MIGTMRYASPEQAKGEALTGKSDLYSLALVLIEAVTGEVPFSADTALGTLMARVDNQLARAAGARRLGPSIERAANPDPAQRPDAGEFSIALMAAAEDLVRPEPLPLVSSISRGEPIVDDRDPTLIAASEVLHADEAGSDLVTDGDRSSALLPERRSSAPVVIGSAAMRPSPYNRFVDAPPRRWPVAVGIAIVVIFALGALGIALANGASTHEVPDLRNRPESEVLDVAAQNGWLTGACRRS